MHFEHIVFKQCRQRQLAIKFLFNGCSNSSDSEPSASVAINTPRHMAVLSMNPVAETGDGGEDAISALLCFARTGCLSSPLWWWFHLVVVNLHVLVVHLVGATGLA